MYCSSKLSTAGRFFSDANFALILFPLPPPFAFKRVRILELRSLMTFSGPYKVSWNGPDFSYPEVRKTVTFVFSTSLIKVFAYSESVSFLCFEKYFNCCSLIVSASFIANSFRSTCTLFSEDLTDLFIFSTINRW